MKLFIAATLLGLISGVYSQGATATDITPVNSTSQDAAIVVWSGGQANPFGMRSLTQEAYDALPRTEGQESLNGTFLVTTPGVRGSYTTPPSGSIVWLSCDGEFYTDGGPTFTSVMQTMIANNVKAVVLYSIRARFCALADLPGYANFSVIYTMANAGQSEAINDAWENSQIDDHVDIFSSSNYGRWERDYDNGHGTTAVAMIILYAITGVITALFLGIIVTGAIRAHRHPERYGPRNVLGRPRQSRARGLARAMLDTIPIVKFGERTPVKDVEQDNAELGQISTSNNAQTIQAGGPASSSSATQPLQAVPENTTDKAAPVTQEEETQGCSICTDDFERGQDIRVLPCSHQFHASCVDPWLLDVSGTCPLCRVDLNPQSAEDGATDDNAALPPPLDPSSAHDAANNGPARKRDTIRHFFAGTRGDLANLRNAGQEERLTFLRQWRESQRAQQSTSTPSAANDATSEQPEDAARRNRLGRFSSLMRRR